MANPAVRVRVRLSTNAPFTASPTWNDITAYVKVEEGIKLKRGRSDILSEVDAGDCTLTLSNQDGRFTTANTSGPYYPNLRKNNRMEIAVSGDNGATWDVRFVGYVNGWPFKWEGKNATAEVTLSDIFKVLEKQGSSKGNYAEQVLNEQPVAFYPLAEEEPAQSFGNVNTSLVVPDASFPLKPFQIRRAIKPFSTEGAVISAGAMELNDNRGAPDSGGGVKFIPAALHGGATLIHGILPSNLPTNWGLDFWVYCDPVLPFPDEDEYAAMITLNDRPLTPASTQLAVGISLRKASEGYVGLFASDGNGGGVQANETWKLAGVARGHIMDGRLHMVTVHYYQSIHTLELYVDGVQVLSTNSITLPATYEYITIGGMDSRQYANYYKGQVRNFSGTLSNVVISDLSNGLYTSPAIRFAAGQGWPGENVGTRIIRLLQMVGLSASQLSIAVGTQLLGAQFTKDGSLLDAAQQAAAVEDMPLYVNQDGQVRFQARTWRNPGSFVGIDAAEFEDIGFIDDDAFIINMVDVDGTSLGKQTLANLDGGTSIANYGEYRHTVGPLPFYHDLQGINLARRLLTRFADPKPRIDVLKIANAALITSPTYAQIRALEPNDGFSITNLNTYFPNHNLGSPYKVYIEGIEEFISWNIHEFNFNCTGLTSFDANENQDGSRNVWQLGVSGHNLLGTQTIVDF